MKKKHLRLLPLMLVPVLVFGACNQTTTPPDPTGDGDEETPTVFEAKSYVGDKTVGSGSVKMYGAEKLALEGYKTVAFEETNDLVAENEGMGWTMLEEPLYGGLPALGYVGNFPEVKAVSLSTAWSCFEERPGEYDWTVMDETIEYWAQQGKTINLRLCTDNLTLNQGVVNGCPAWLFEEPYNVPFVTRDGEVYADLSDATYQEQLRKFLNAFAGHYNDENYTYRDAIEVVELRGYGQWGEWHSGWNTYSSVEERTETLRKIIAEWREAWEGKLLVISCTYEFVSAMTGVTNPADYEEFMSDMGYDYVLQQDGITFRRDGIAFALREYDSRMALDYFYMNTGLPLFGEIGDAYEKHSDTDPYPLFEAMSEALHKWRVNYNTVISWTGQAFNDVIQNETELVEYFNRLMGYRLVPDKMQYSSEVKAGDKLYLNSLWSNQAMGRAWKDHDLSVYLENAAGETVYTGTDARFNPVSINGGEPHFFNLSYRLPEDLAKGTYTLKFAVTDEKGAPKLALPIAGNDGNKKYYLGEVTVGDKAAQDITETDDLNGDTAFKPVGDGKITARLTTADGTKAILGEGDGVFAQGKKLKNGATYYVSFDYKTNKSDIHITDDSRYLVGAYAADESWGDHYEWLDVSNNVSHRSATIHVPDDGKEYVLAFGGKNGVAEIAIDNISVLKADTVNVSFNRNESYATREEDGSFTLKSTNTANWAEALQLRETLDPHATYMLTFDAKTTIEISNGGFFYVMLKDADDNMNYEENKYGSIESFSLGRIGSFWTPADRGYQRYSFVFNTGDYAEGSSLVFGIRNMGGVNLKNITMTRINTDFSYHADPVTIAHNTRPSKNIDVNAEDGLFENFEAGVFNGTSMYPGPNTTGILRSGKNTIDGEYTVYCDNNNPGAGDTYDWNVFLQTNPAEFLFSANTTYRVRFEFKVLRDVEDGSFYFAARRKDGAANQDKGFYQITKGQCEVGEVYHIDYEFTTGSFEYIFMWGIHLSGAIAIDNVHFELVGEVGSSTAGDNAPYVAQNVKGPTKGRADWEFLTNDLLYHR